MVPNPNPSLHAIHLPYTATYALIPLKLPKLPTTTHKPSHRFPFPFPSPLKPTQFSLPSPDPGRCIRCPASGLCQRAVAPKHANLLHRRSIWAFLALTFSGWLDVLMGCRDCGFPEKGNVGWVIMRGRHMYSDSL